jgi:hypothetical protein
MRVVSFINSPHDAEMDVIHAHAAAAAQDGAKIIHIGREIMEQARRETRTSTNFETKYGCSVVYEGEGGLMELAKLICKLG